MRGAQLWVAAKTCMEARRTTIAIAIYGNFLIAYCFIGEIISGLWTYNLTIIAVIVVRGFVIGIKGILPFLHFCAVVVFNGYEKFLTVG